MHTSKDKHSKHANVLVIIVTKSFCDIFAIGICSHKSFNLCKLAKVTIQSNIKSFFSYSASICMSVVLHIIK